MIRATLATAIAVFILPMSPVSAELKRDRRIDAADAQTITDTCLALAAKSGWKVHVAVLSEYGDLIRFVGMDGATRTSGVLAQGKARTVFRTGRSSREVAKMDPSAQNAFDAVAIGGGVPVIVDGRMIGVAAASGALPEQDEACVAAGIEAAM
jgi:glc operon protein GlcG